MNFRSLLAADWRFSVVCVWLGLAKKSSPPPPIPGTDPRSSPTQAGGWVSEPTVADLRVVPVGRISYKFVIVYRSAIAGRFIKEQNYYYY